jgi:hypothetical protein
MSAVEDAFGGDVDYAQLVTALLGRKSGLGGVGAWRCGPSRGVSKVGVANFYGRHSSVE